MPQANDIVLRPRFKFEVQQNNESALKAFEDLKNVQSDFVINRSDDHVFIKLPKNKQHFWSPQLHLEINAIDDKTSQLYGLFGPNPTIWTMFMFFHFIVACLFIGFGIWAYTNWSLGNSYAIQLFMTFLMIVIWFTLYFAGRMGKKTGTAEMYKLHAFMRDTLRGEFSDIQGEKT